MKKLFLALLMVAGTLSAQERTVFVDSTLEPYVNNFIEVLHGNGWDINEVTQGQDVFIIFDAFIDKPLPEGVAGVALGMNNPTVYVMINIEIWVTLDEWQKQDLINHELMHDIFNVEHTDEEDRTKLMHPNSYPSNWGQAMLRLFDAFKDLKNG